MESKLEGIRCKPSRRSIKFIAGPHARHFLGFDSAISKEERLIFSMTLFIFYSQLVDPDLVTGYTPAEYLPEDLVEVRVVTDPRHPAYQQCGLYAKRMIPNNTIITPYSGFIEVFSTSCNSRTYTMGFGAISDDYALDAEFAGNYGRFANDPRSVEGLTANLKAESRFNSRGEPFTALVTRRQIAEGEEILMAYGKAHSLSPSPWINTRGEVLFKYRSESAVPFPSLANSTERPGRGVNLSHKGNVAQPRESSVNNSLPSIGGPISLPAANDIPSAYDIAWECTQCGMWNLCTGLSIEKVEYCSHCSTPKLAGAQLIAVLSSPPLNSESLAAEGEMALQSGMDAIFSPERNPSHPHATVHFASNRQPPMPLSRTPALLFPPPNLTNSRKRKRLVIEQTAPSAFFSSQEGSPTLGSPCSSVVSPPTRAPHHPSVYSSVHVEWPMNIPFMPWQVWDNAISMTVLSKYSKFVPHEHVFLYSVNTQEEREDEADEHTQGKKGVDHDDRETSRDRRARLNRCKKRRSYNNWPHPPTVSSEPALLETPKQGAELPCEAIHGAHRDFPSMQRAAPDTATASTAASPARRDSHAPKFLCETSEKLGLFFFRNLLRMHPNMECFTLLHTRQPSRRVGSSSRVQAWPTPLESARRLLLNLSHRQFSGKSFQPGELVGYMGGCIRPINDIRCRPDDSPLAIPMKYLIPQRWRLQHRRAIAHSSTESGPSHARSCDDQGEWFTDAKEPSMSVDASVVTLAKETFDTQASDFLDRLSSLCLVVTNDMMYCPCLALADSDDDEVQGDDSLPEFFSHPDHPGLRLNHDATEQEVLPTRTHNQPDPLLAEEANILLKSCNIALVLSMDGLGSPFVGLVAIRAINAFEPLMARTQ